MTDIPQIRRRADGSIDACSYLAEGRVHRSKAAHNAAGCAGKKSSNLLTTLVALAVIIPFIRQG